MDLAGLIDMDYFWWTFMKVMGFGIIFLVIFIAISSSGHLLEVIIGAFKRMKN
jgi:hypothetical protein